MDRTVVFILSTNYAGSHFASLMVGSHSKAAHVGEVRHLRKKTVTKAICVRCGSFQECQLFKDIRPETIDQAFDIVFSAIPPEKSVIVDNSKKTEWVTRFLDRPGFRGIDDPYEAPERPDIVLETVIASPEENARLVCAYLERLGFVR